MDLVDFTTGKSDKTRRLDRASKFLLTFYESVGCAITHNWYLVNWLKNKHGLAPLSSGGYRTIFLCPRTFQPQKIESPGAQIALTERGSAGDALASSPVRTLGRWALQSTYAPVTAAARYVRDHVRAKEAVRCERPAGAEADRRSADLPRRQTGGLHGSDRGCGGEQEAGAGLGGAARRGRAAADHAGWREQSAAALVARFQADCLRFRSRRIVTDLADGP